MCSQSKSFGSDEIVAPTLDNIRTIPVRRHCRLLSVREITEIQLLTRDATARHSVRREQVDVGR